MLYVSRLKTKWEDGNVDYNNTVQDSRYDHNFNSLWGRLKRAGRILFGKPIYYNDVYIQDKNRFRQLIQDMQDLLNEDF